MKKYLIIGLLGWLTICSAKNLIVDDASFETGFGPWPRTGEIVDGGYDGSKCLKAGGNMMSQVTFPLGIGRKSCFSVYLKALELNTPVVVSVYRTNWVGDIVVKKANIGTEWERVALEIPAQTIDTHNLVWLRISPAKGKIIFIDACQMEYDQLTDYQAGQSINSAADVQSPVEGNVFYADEKIKINVNYFNNLNTPVELPTFISLIDYYGNKKFSLDKKISINGKNSYRESLDLPEKFQKGFYVLNFGITDPEGNRQEQKASFVVVDKPLPFAENAGSLFGICGGPDSRIAACGRIGVKYFSLELRWFNEISPGVLDEAMMKRYEETADLCKNNGIIPVAYLRRTPAWARINPNFGETCPPKMENVKYFENFAYMVGERFKNRIKNWQLWGGETDLLRDRINAQLGIAENDFIDILVGLYKAGYTGLKRANPENIVETAAVSGVDCADGKFDFSRKVLVKAQGFYDEFVIHPYCYPYTFDKGKYVQSPEEHNLIPIYQEALKLSRNAISNGEYGYAIAKTESLDSADSKRMADYMVRSFLLTAASNTHVQKLMWYADPDAFAIWEWPNPRPLVAAYAALAQILTGCEKGSEIRLAGGQIIGYSFTKKSGGSIAALWVPANKKVKILLPTRDDWKIIDIMGNPIKAGKELELSGSPVYFVSTLSSDELHKLLVNVEVMLKPVEASLRLKNSKLLNIYLSNQRKEQLDGKVVVTLPVNRGETKNFELAFSKIRPGVNEILCLNLPESIDFDNLNGKTVSGKVITPLGEMPFTHTFELFKCAEFKTPISIDGNLQDWEGRDFIELKTVDYLFPPDAFSHELWTGEADLSIKAYVGWDEKNFYFAAKVTDDLFINDNNAGEIWDGDSIQLAFNLLNDAFNSGYKRNDREYTIGSSTKVDHPVILCTWPMPAMEIEAQLAVKRDKGCITYELALPFKRLSPMKPEPGSVFGFNFVALDADYRKVDYWMGLTYGICGGKNPSFFKNFILSK